MVVWHYQSFAFHFCKCTFYSPPLIYEGIKLWWCLTSRAYIGPKSRTERCRKNKIGTEVARVTCDSDTNFKVKGQGHQATLLITLLVRPAAAAVGVGTCWPWENDAMLPLPSAFAICSLRRPGGRWGLGAYRCGRPPTACLWLISNHTEWSIV